MNNKTPHHNIFSSTVKSVRISFICCTLLCFFLIGLITACDKINNFFRPYVATVNGSKIYLDDYQASLDKKINMVPKDFLNQPDYMKKFEEEVLDSMIKEKIM